MSWIILPVNEKLELEDCIKQIESLIHVVSGVRMRIFTTRDKKVMIKRFNLYIRSKI